MSKADEQQSKYMNYIEASTAKAIEIQPFEEVVAAYAAVVAVEGAAHYLVNPRVAEMPGVPSLLGEISRPPDTDPQIFEGDDADVIMHALDVVASGEVESTYRPVAKRMLHEALDANGHSALEEDGPSTATYTDMDFVQAQRQSQKHGASLILAEPLPVKKVRGNAEIRIASKFVSDAATKIVDERVELVGFEDIATAHRAVVINAPEEGPDPEIVDALQGGLTTEWHVIFSGKTACRLYDALKQAAETGPNGEPQDKAAVYMLRTATHSADAIAA